MRSNWLKPRSGGVRFLQVVVRAASFWLRTGESARTTLVYDGGYSSTDGRMERKDSRITLTVLETDHGTVFSGDFDGMPVRNFHTVVDDLWEFQWEVNAKDTVVTVNGFVAKTGKGDETLYTHFRYTPDGEQGSQMHVYGEYQLQK